MVVNPVQDFRPISSAAQDALSLKQVFRSITAESCPHHFNFHMHTCCSDGRLEPEQLIEQAIALGLQGLAITDHHTTNGYQRATERLAQLHQSALHSHGSSLPHLWTGMEINAGLLDDEVHILAYAFNPKHEALQPYMQRDTVDLHLYAAETVILAIHKAGGLAILAHPARYRRSHAELIPAAADAGINGIETYYAYNNPSPWRPSPRQTEEVYELGQQYGLLHTCGTDTHGMNLLQRL